MARVRSERKLRSVSEVNNSFRNDLKTDICYDVIEGVKTSTYCPFHPKRRNSKQAVLLSALGEGVVQPGAQCTGFTQHETGVCACFAGGKEVWGDVLIGADGIHSLIRSQLFGQAKPRYAGYTAWRSVTPFQVEHKGEGRITLLGDAAHPMTPNMGQGACQAIEDAIVLAACLRNASDMAAALRAYEEKRIKRTAAIVNRSRSIGRVAQWENPLACSIRNAILKRTPSGVLSKQLRWAVEYEA